MSPRNAEASSASSAASSSSDQPIYYFVYIQSNTSLSIIYKYDAIEAQILPLSTFLLKDTKQPPSHMKMGATESKFILGVLKNESLIVSDETKWRFPMTIGISNRDMFRNFLPIKRQKASSLPRPSELVSHISLERPTYAPPVEESTEPLIDKLKKFRIGLGSLFLTFDEAKFCVLVYSQLVLKRPYKVFHSEISRESYTVTCPENTCPFTISIRVSINLVNEMSPITNIIFSTIHL